MELIIVTIGIGLSLVLNIVAIAVFHHYVSQWVAAICEYRNILIDLMNDLPKQITEENKKSRRQVTELRKQMSKNRVDIMNEVYAVQAMIRDGKKRREMK